MPSTLVFRDFRWSASASASDMLDVEKLFTDNYEGLFRYLVRLTGDSDLAADVAQETFVRLVEREPDNTGIRAWLYRVATNLVRDHSRVARRRIELLQERSHRVPHGDAPTDAHLALEIEEKRQAVRNALEALSERDRTVLLMREEGFSHEEIATAVGTTTKSIGRMIARALQKLSNKLTLTPDSRE
jgi:RNA polymerase sigma factor (sigma-70 family)